MEECQLDYEALSEILRFGTGTLKAWVEGEKYRPPSDMKNWIQDKVRVYRRNHPPPKKKEEEKKTKVNVEPKTAPPTKVRIQKSWPRGISAARINQFLQASRWSYADLAKEIGVSEATVKRWCKGAFTPQTRFHAPLRKLLENGPPEGRPTQEVIRLVTTSFRVRPMSPKEVIETCSALKKGRQLSKVL